MVENIEDYKSLIKKFEQIQLNLDEWHHSEHVAVGVWYLLHFPKNEAIEKMKNGIKALNAKLGLEQTQTSGYHETWTIFFMLILSKFISNEENKGLNKIQLMNACIQHLSDFRGLSREYYSKEVIMSWEARKSWCPPDLKEFALLG